MAYVILIVGGFYGLYWLVIWLFSLTTKGERSILIPLALSLFFTGIAGFGWIKLEESKVNPELLTIESYKGLDGTLTPIAVSKKFGGLEPVDVSSKVKALRKVERKIADLEKQLDNAEDDKEEDVDCPEFSIFAACSQTQKPKKRKDGTCYITEVDKIYAEKLALEDERKLKKKEVDRFDLAMNNIMMPSDLLSRLRTSNGEYQAAEKKAKIELSIFGAPSQIFTNPAKDDPNDPANQPKPKKGEEVVKRPYVSYLGMPAPSQEGKAYNGLKNAEIRFFIPDETPKYPEGCSPDGKENRCVTHEQHLKKKRQELLEKTIEDAGIKARVDLLAENKITEDQLKLITNIQNLYVDEAVKAVNKKFDTMSREQRTAFQKKHNTVALRKVVDDIDEKINKVKAKIRTAKKEKKDFAALTTEKKQLLEDRKLPFKELDEAIVAFNDEFKAYKDKIKAEREKEITNVKKETLAKAKSEMPGKDASVFTAKVFDSGVKVMNRLDSVVKGARKKAGKDFLPDPIRPKALAGSEWIYTEGKDWKYEAGQNQKQVAESLRKFLDDQPQWKATITDTDASISLQLRGSGPPVGSKLLGLKFRIFYPQQEASMKMYEERRLLVTQEKEALKQWEDEKAVWDKEKAAWEEKNPAKELPKKYQEFKKEKPKLTKFRPLEYPAVEGMEWVIEEGKSWSKSKDNAVDSANAIKSALEKLKLEDKPLFKVEVITDKDDEDKVKADIKITPVHEKLLAAQGNFLMVQHMLPEDADKFLVGKPVFKVASNSAGDPKPFTGGIDSTRIHLEPESPEHSGSDGNSIRLQVTRSKSLRVNDKMDGEFQKMKTGAYAAKLEFFYETDPVLDEDFNSSPRLVVVGYSGNQKAAVKMAESQSADAATDKSPICTKDCRVVSVGHKGLALNVNNQIPGFLECMKEWSESNCQKGQSCKVPTSTNKQCCDKVSGDYFAGGGIRGPEPVCEKE